MQFSVDILVLVNELVKTSTCTVFGVSRQVLTLRLRVLHCDHGIGKES